MNSRVGVYSSLAYFNISGAFRDAVCDRFIIFSCLSLVLSFPPPIPKHIHILPDLTITCQSLPVSLASEVGC